MHRSRDPTAITSELRSIGSRLRVPRADVCIVAESDSTALAGCRVSALLTDVFRQPLNRFTAAQTQDLPRRLT